MIRTVVAVLLVPSSHGFVHKYLKTLNVHNSLIFNVVTYLCNVDEHVTLRCNQIGR